jgi:hypothetical protein
VYEATSSTEFLKELTVEIDEQLGNEFLWYDQKWIDEL